MCENNGMEMMTDVDLAWEILMASKTNVRVAVTIAPAVRVAMGEAFGLTTGEDVMGKLTTALRTLGADVVVDGAIAEDALVYELACEVKNRLKNGGALPVVYSKKREWETAALKNPDLAPHIVTVRPPFQALAVELKKMFLGDGKRTYVIAIVPCLGKKAAAENVGLRVGDLPAADLALTTIELADMLIAAGLDLKYIPASACDQPFGTSSGCGYIADIGGGIAEGVLRSLAADQSEEGIRRIEYSGVRGYKDVRIGYSDYNAAVVSGAANADEMAMKILDGECDCVFVEVVGNPLGCAAGRGQPKCDENAKRVRAYSLQCLDKKSETRVADAAEDTVALYGQFVEARGNDGFVEVDASLAPFDEEVVVEEPIIEEPVVEEVVVEEPVIEEPVVEEVVVEEPVIEEPVAEEVVVVEEPIIEETVVEEVVVEEPVIEEPVVEEVVVEEPVIEEPVVEEVVVEEPIIEEPVVEEVVVEEPVIEEPVVEEVVVEEPIIEEPVVEEVVVEEPIIEEPVVEEVVVEEPIFDEADLAPKTFDPNYRRMSKKERRKMKRMKN